PPHPRSNRTFPPGNLADPPLTLRPVGVRRPGLAQVAQRVPALLAEALLVAVAAVPVADGDAPPARGAIQGDVGGVPRLLRQEPAALGIAAVGLEVLVHPVDSLDHHLADVGQHAQDPPGRAGIIPGHHLHDVVFADVHGYTTSAARLTIFR